MTVNPSELRDSGLAAARYVSLATRRRDGSEVLTPVWIAALNERLYCYSAGEAGKVKRIRRDPAVRLATCNVRGDQRGPWHAARARILTATDETAPVYASLIKKYGWQMRVANLIATLTGRSRRRDVIELTLHRGDP